jgi:hypothetical protein
MGRKRDIRPWPAPETITTNDSEKTERTLREAGAGDILEFRRWANKILKKHGVWPSRYQAESFAKAQDLSLLWGRQQFEALDEKFKRRRKKRTKRT